MGDDNHFQEGGDHEAVAGTVPIHQVENIHTPLKTITLHLSQWISLSPLVWLSLFVLGTMSYIIEWLGYGSVKIEAEWMNKNINENYDINYQWTVGYLCAQDKSY